jgi:hypothetical protein
VPGQGVLERLVVGSVGMGADDDLLERIARGVSGYTEERRYAVQKTTRNWETDTGATDKALRNCVFGSALSVLEGMRVKRSEERDALTEVGSAGFSGYAIGRGLLGTETARPSYSQSPADERDNAIRIHERSETWSHDSLMGAFSASELLVSTLQTQASSWLFGNIVGARRAKPVLLAFLVSSVAFAMAEEDMFGPFPSANVG